MRSYLPLAVALLSLVALTGCADTSAEDKVIQDHIAVQNELAELYEKGWEDDGGARRNALWGKLNLVVEKKLEAAWKRARTERMKAEARLDAVGKYDLRPRVGWLYAEPNRKVHVLLAFNAVGSPQATLLDQHAIPTKVVRTEGILHFVITEKDGKKEKLGLNPTVDFFERARPTEHEAGQKGTSWFGGSSPNMNKKYSPEQLQFIVEVKGVTHTLEFVEDLKPK